MQWRQKKILRCHQVIRISKPQADHHCRSRDRHFSLTLSQQSKTNDSNKPKIYHDDRPQSWKRSETLNMSCRLLHIHTTSLQVMRKQSHLFQVDNIGNQHSALIRSRSIELNNLSEKKDCISNDRSVAQMGWFRPNISGWGHNLLQQYQIELRM